MIPAIALSIVIPAFNEADCIAGTIRSWSDEARRLRIDHEILVYDDGSTDATEARIAAVARDRPDIRFSRHANRGHGPTILKGYREARGEWLLQVDGDDEVGTGPFESMWGMRDRYDLVIGCRGGRNLGVSRRLLTLGSRLAVRLVFGRGVSDVNAPYRLIRRSRLSKVLPHLPDDMFAPNVAITALAIRQGWNIREVPVQSRLDGSRRQASWGSAPVAWLALKQLLAASRRNRRT